MTKLREDLRELLYRALAEPVGLLLHSADPSRARTMIYQTRAAIGDPELARLQVRLVADMPDGNIALVKGHHFPSPEYQPISAPSQLNLVSDDLDL